MDASFLGDKAVLTTNDGQIIEVAMEKGGREVFASIYIDGQLWGGPHIGTTGTTPSGGSSRA